MEKEHLFIPDYEDTEITVDKETVSVGPPPAKKHAEGIKNVQFVPFMTTI